jgi:hypothetical protein
MTKRDDSQGEEEKRAEDSEQAPAKREEPAPSAADEDEDETEDDDEDDEDEAEAEETAASKRPEPRRAAKAQPSRHGKREQPTKPAAGKNVPLSRVVAFVVVALAAGAAGGWFGHDEQLKARVKAESLAAPAGSGALAGPCGAWQQKICDSGGKT